MATDHGLKLLPPVAGGMPTLDVIHHCSALELLRALPDGCVNLLATDPPYYRVKDEDWDRQWDSADLYLEWLGDHLREMRRVLAPNGSLYLFASPPMAARVEVEAGRWFNVLNQIIWSKQAWADKWGPEDRRRAYSPQTERVIFAEPFGADSFYDGALIDENSTYWEACENLKRGIFGDYLTTEFARAKVTRKEIAALFPSKTGGLTGCVSNWILGYNCPTREQYQAMRDYLNTHHKNGSGEYLRQDYEDLRQDYEDLRQDYEDLRRQYESLRRPFNVSADVPYTDVWDFSTVNTYPGKHPAEKPLAMMRHIVTASSRPDDLVVDPFSGSGTTLAAARIEGRRYIGADMDAHWAHVARRKVRDAGLNMAEAIDASKAGQLVNLPLFAGVC